MSRSTVPKSLAELRASEAVGLPERTKSLCLSQKLIGRVQALTEEREALRIDAAAANPEDPARPQRLGEGPDHDRIAAIEVELESVWSEMREHTGELLLRGVTSGEWRRWAQAHPARRAQEGSSDSPQWITNPLDEQYGYGYVNVDDLLGTLGQYAAAWNGEPLAEGDWDFIANRAAPGDLKSIVTEIVKMHEGEGVRAPKASPKPSSGSQQSAIS